MCVAHSNTDGRGARRQAEGQGSRKKNIIESSRRVAHPFGRQSLQGDQPRKGTGMHRAPGSGHINLLCTSLHPSSPILPVSRCWTGTASGFKGSALLHIPRHGPCLCVRAKHQRATALRSPPKEAFREIGRRVATGFPFSLLWIRRPLRQLLWTCYRAILPHSPDRTQIRRLTHCRPHRRHAHRTAVRLPYAPTPCHATERNLRLQSSLIPPPRSFCRSAELPPSCPSQSPTW